MFFVRGNPDDKKVGAIIPWLSPGFFNNVYHSANLFTSNGTTGAGNDPKADQLYQAAVSELDDAKAKQLWQQLMHYGYDTVWVNIELVEMPSYFVVRPNVGAFTVKQNLSLWDAYVGIHHAA
jgi:ABC-type transport system substrate-binding protein